VPNNRGYVRWQASLYGAEFRKIWENRPEDMNLMKGLQFAQIAYDEMEHSYYMTVNRDNMKSHYLKFSLQDDDGRAEREYVLDDGTRIYLEKSAVNEFDLVASEPREVVHADDFRKARALKRGDQIIPVSVSLDQDIVYFMAKWWRDQGYAAEDVNLINFDRRPNIEEPGLGGPLSIHNWITKLAKDPSIKMGNMILVQRISEVFDPKLDVAARTQSVRDSWRGQKRMEETYTPENLYIDPFTMAKNVSGPAIITIDYSWIATDEEVVLSDEKIFRRVNQIVNVILDRGIEPAAINFTFATYLDDHFIHHLSAEKISGMFIEAFKKRGYEFRTGVTEREMAQSNLKKSPDLMSVEEYADEISYLK
jgi:hypothetical protein